MWQRNYYEHILINETDLYCTRNYIKNNPLKWEIDELYKSNQNMQYLPVESASYFRSSIFLIEVNLPVSNL